MNEWGGGVLPPDVNNIARKKSKKEVKLMRLSNYLKDVVGTRSLPDNFKTDLKPTVLMKMDIEGSEVPHNESAPNLLQS